MASLEGLKVVAAQEMGRIESHAYAEGASEYDFMQNAGAAVASALEDFISDHGLEKNVLLLAGKGNNGGDAYAAGTVLLKKGFYVAAWQLYPIESGSPLCQENYKQFKQAGGEVHLLTDETELSFDVQGVILDGIVGTGFQGKAEGIMEKVILFANASGLPMLAIDIPSGVNGTSGEVGSVAIHADVTISLGLPKIGFFVGAGYDHVGDLIFAEFGLGQKYIDEAKPAARLCNVDMLPFFLPEIKRTRQKYETGYAVAMAGSPGMSGAALLSSFAFLRAGGGIIRLFHPQEMEVEMSKAPYEVIRQPWDLEDTEKFFQECKRASALLLGPGIGRGEKAQKALKEILARAELPCVIDADALYFIAENPSWKLPSKSVLTPHKGEMERLLQLKSSGGEDLHALCQKYAEEKKVTLLLKGAPTFIFHPGEVPLIIPLGDPGMAKAGTGDVLTGIIAALLAQKLSPRVAAIMGAALHALAGEYVAYQKTSYCLVAHDLIDALPDVFHSILTGLLEKPTGV